MINPYAKPRTSITWIRMLKGCVAREGYDTSRCFVLRNKMEERRRSTPKHSGDDFGEVEAMEEENERGQQQSG